MIFFFFFYFCSYCNYYFLKIYPSFIIVLYFYPQTTKRPLTAGTNFKNSIIALIANLASKVRSFTFNKNISDSILISNEKPSSQWSLEHDCIPCRGVRAPQNECYGYGIKLNLVMRLQF